MKVSQPHIVSLMPAILRDAWWFIRGVEGDYYRRICDRCGYTGTAHWSFFVPIFEMLSPGFKRHQFCLRFKPKPGEK
jgi:hypothetical protein